MASSDLFALSRSALNPFLYADIVGADGTAALTPLSLFGQRGEDPWDAAAGLAALPAGTAAARLAAMIADVPAHPCSLPDATATAERLVALLPKSAEIRRPVPAPPTPLALLLRWPPQGWPLGGLTSLALGLAVLVAVLWVWLTLVDALM